MADGTTSSQILSKAQCRKNEGETALRALHKLTRRLFIPVVNDLANSNWRKLAVHAFHCAEAVWNGSTSDQHLWCARSCTRSQPTITDISPTNHWQWLWLGTLSSMNINAYDFWKTPTRSRPALDSTGKLQGWLDSMALMDHQCDMTGCVYARLNIAQGCSTSIHAMHPNASWSLPLCFIA